MKLWTLFLSLALAGAQTAPPALKSIIGEVTALDASAKQIKVKADDGALYTINLGDATSYLRIPPGEKDLKKATKITFTDVAVGDRARHGFEQVAAPESLRRAGRSAAESAASTQGRRLGITASR